MNAPDPDFDRALERWGWDEAWAAAAAPLLGEGRLVGRVTSEDRLGYMLQTARGELRAVLPGRLRKAAIEGAALKPAVGDWIVVEDRRGQDSLPVLDVVPRRSKLARKAAGEEVEQIVGANVDEAFLVTGVDADLNPRRLERYRAVCEDGGVTPVVVLTKCDLVDRVDAALATVHAAVPDVETIAVSNVDGRGLDVVDAHLKPGVTLALIGSSGVGKSTIVNRWLGDVQQATSGVDDRGRGRHTTSSRSLFLVESGALVMDTPGMRELALWEADEGVRATFADVEALAAQCRFRDCTHHREPGCAVRAAIEDGTLDPLRVQSFQKLLGELDRQRAPSRTRATSAPSGRPPRRRR